MARMYKIIDEQMVVEEEICEILDANMMMEYEDEEDKSGDRMDEIDEEGWRRTSRWRELQLLEEERAWKIKYCL